MRANLKINGKVVFITGAASGIGKALAIKIARFGGKVVIADVNIAKAEEVIQEIQKITGPNGPCESFAVFCDVSDVNSIKDAGNAVRNRFGPPDILVNNAGIVKGKSFLELTHEDIEKTFKINVISQFFTIKEFLPDMVKKNKGHIVTIASFAGHVGSDKLVDYTSSKFACVGLDEALRNELKIQGLNIKTTCVNPYFIDTGMFSGVKTPIKLLKESEVVNEIFNAILSEKKVIFLPKYLGVLLKMLKPLPICVYDFLIHTFKFNRSMDTFTGRPKL
jgi:all-trans-retinol dehydrogenase (NAD+)